VDARDAEQNYVGPDEIKNALIFARATADAEVESIERIHRRTLVSFGYVGGAVLALAALFGYIGYSNLQKAAITTAKAQMQKEVEEQVREKLTTEHIDQIVRDQLRDLSASSLHEQIHKELISDPLASSIRQAAETETKAQIAKQFAPRHLSAAQSALLLQKLAAVKELKDFPIAVTTWQFDFEATTYAGELRTCFSHSTMKVQPLAHYDKDPVDGLGIYYDKRQPEHARLLQEALRAAGLDSKLVPGTFDGGQLANSVFQGVIKPGEDYPLELFVGSRTIK
jgi:hypothetical protein